MRYLISLLILAFTPLSLFALKSCSENLYIGATINYKFLHSQSSYILDKEFRYVTPENSFKQTYIHPRPNIWRWKKSDKWIRYIIKHKKIARLHAPISPQCSKWIKDDKRTPKELEQNMKEYLTALYKRYSKIKNIEWIDVVNETVLKNGEWNHAKSGTNKWENPWIKIGYDTYSPLKPPIYIKKAFILANTYAPNFKQIINQGGGMEKPMWDKIKKLVLYLRQEGLKVDGIGWQAHINVGFEKIPGNMQKLDSLIDWSQKNNLEFHITENNVWLKESNNLKAQANTFSAIIKLLIKKSKKGIITWNTWNLRDIESRRNNCHGSIYFNDFKPKPAYYAIKKALNECK